VELGRVKCGARKVAFLDVANNRSEPQVGCPPTLEKEVHIVNIKCFLPPEFSLVSGEGVLAIICCCRCLHSSKFPKSWASMSLGLGIVKASQCSLGPLTRSGSSGLQQQVALCAASCTCSGTVLRPCR
jgi:hypothetical protein